MKFEENKSFICEKDVLKKRRTYCLDIPQKLGAVGFIRRIKTGLKNKLSSYFNVLTGIGIGECSKNTLHFPPSFAL